MRQKGLLKWLKKEIRKSCNIRYIIATKLGVYRLNALDKLKFLCAFLVVCIHAPFPGEWGEFVYRNRET